MTGRHPRRINLLIGRLTLAMLGFAAAGIFGRVVAAESMGVLDNARKIHALNHRQSADGLPVKLRGIVTYNRGVGSEFTIQDATGGIMLDWHEYDRLRELKNGTEVEIEGRTVINPPTPRVRVERLRVVGNPGLPRPRQSTLPELLNNDLEGSLVEFTAVLRTVTLEDQVIPPRLSLGFGPANARLTVWITRWDDNARASYQPGATLRVKGVLMRWKTATWLPYSTFAVAQEFYWVSVVSPPPPDSQPAMTISETVESFSPTGADQRTRVTGTVTLSRPDYLVIEEKNSALRLKLRNGQGFQPGHRVEAIGFLGQSGAKLELEDAEVISWTEGTLPAAVLLETDNFKRNEPQWMDGRLVSLRGEIKQTSASISDSIIWMNFGDTILPLRLPPAKSSDLPQPGSIIEVRGVLNAELNSLIQRTGRGMSSYELIVQSTDSIRTIREAPWWNQKRLMSALAIILAVAGASALWALSLRKRVAEKTAALASEITARHDQEVIASERQRLASDLHDTLEQTLTGASLQLEALEALDPSKAASKRIGNPLQLARKLLDRSRDELRRAVWDLTPGMLEQMGLPAALALMAEEQKRRREIGINLTCGEGIVDLPDSLASHLFRVIQEASSNAIRHGHAGEITINLHCRENIVHLEVRDDGTGFDPSTSPGIREGHFGLNGMKERLRRLGGTFHISSEPGKGTCVTASCPRESRGIGEISIRRDGLAPLST